MTPTGSTKTWRVIRRKRGLSALGLSELWPYRELFGFLVWRDVLVRYKQTVIGVLWAVLRPLLTMVVFTVIFGKIAKLSSDGVPYAVLTFTALLPWQFFANSLTESSHSMVANAGIISKIYFPRLIIPTSAVMTGVVDFLISLVILAAMMAWYGMSPTPAVLWTPLFLLMAFCASFGLGLWLSALSVEYRDVRHIVPFLVQMGLYVSPVAYSSSVIPAQWRFVYYLNPMAGVIDGFRWAMLGTGRELYAPGLLAGALVAAALTVTGALYFRRMERTFADVI